MHAQYFSLINLNLKLQFCAAASCCFLIYLSWIIQRYKEQYNMKSELISSQGALSQVSLQNITSILEDLLKDYDKTERPSYKDGIVVK